MSLPTLAMMALSVTTVRAHVTGDAAHDELVRMIAQELAAGGAAVRTGPWRIAQVRTEKRVAGGGDSRAGANAPGAAEIFGAFAPAVNVRWDGEFLYVESNGLSAHGMMVGITAWQQQVPLPQPYVGRNAWRIPLHPVASANPVSIKGRFLRGAIALAANGVPIFNPQNNRGEISQEIGELDEWGGHCGRGDDYHYHAAPLHLQSVVGAGRPIAYALDGYALYGTADADGNAPTDLDEFNGRTEQGVYRYYSTTKYPYINGGLRGVVTVRGDGVEPQPRDAPVRPAGQPLRGAKVTEFTRDDAKGEYALKYELRGKTLAVSYAIRKDGTYAFVFTDAAGRETGETYRRRERKDGPPPRKGE